MIALDRALHRLLHKQSYRRAFLEGRPADLDVSEETAAALSTLDPGTLEDLAQRVAAGALARAHAGVGCLLDLYPRTIEAFHCAHPETRGTLALAFAFLDSTAFDAYREVPFAGLGTCIEEAFFRFCEVEAIGDSATREREFHAAIIKVLAVTPHPAMQWPACVRRTRTGCLCLSTRSMPPFLHAVASGQVVQGPLTPFLADLLAEGADPAIVAQRHQVGGGVLEAAVQRLSQLGIWKS